MAHATDIGTGATAAFGTSSIVSEITNISWSGVTRDTVESSHLGTVGAKTVIGGDLYDPGALTFQGHIDQNSTGNPPITQAMETSPGITLTFPNAKIWTANGALQSFEVTVPLEDKMVCTGVVKFSGAITFAV